MPPRKAPNKQAQSEAMADAAVVNRMAVEAPAPRVQPPAGRAVAMGRDGKPIWRTATPQSEDAYARAQDLAPDGWVYEWKRNSIHNKTEEAYHSQLMRAGGWSYVTHDRHPGVWGSVEAKGNVIVGDQVLMERPLVLHIEALNEEKRAADERMRRAKTERGLQAASAGIDTNTPDARQATYVKQPYDPDLAQDVAAARPKYDRDNMSID